MTSYLPCLLCTQTFLNASTVVEHCQREHDPGLATSTDVYGHVCPVCGRTYQRLEQHSSRTHHRPVALLFADARRAGDPHGVVVRQVNLLLDAQISALEQATR